MRALLLGAMITWVACRPGNISEAQETCALASAMFARCEDFGSAAPIDRDLIVDRWRGVCRAVLTGETAQMASNVVAIYQLLSDSERGQLRHTAECTAKETTCDAYRACEK